MLRSIRWRLVASYLLLTLITVAVVGLVMLYILKLYFVRQEKAQLLQNAESLAGRISQLDTRADRDRLLSLVSAYSLLSQAQVRIWDESRQLLLDSQDLPAELKMSFVVVNSRHDGTVEIGFRADTASAEGAQFSTMMTDHKSPWGGYVFVVEATRTASAAATPTRALSRSATPTPLPLRVQVAVADTSGGIGYVEMARDSIRGRQLLESVRTALIWASLAALGLAIGMGIMISHTLTTPIASLARTAKAMATGNLRARAPAGRSDEIGDLACQFNQMAANLEQTVATLAAERDALRRLIADISHELRTPITALKTFNELLLDQAWDDPEARREFLLESQKEISRLDWLTENLLQLSRLEAGLLKMNCEPCRLGELVAGVAAIFRPQAEAKGLTLRVEKPADTVWVECDRQWVEQAVGNLLSNAIKFTPSGGSVTVGVRELSTSAELWVEDTGIGIPAEDLPRIFERFYRGDDASETGSGLGLAIVHSVVEAHGGHITVTTEVGKGSRFSVHLPKSPGGAGIATTPNATRQGL